MLVVLWGRFFHGALLLAKISGLVLWFVLISGLWALVAVDRRAPTPHLHSLLRFSASLAPPLLEGREDMCFKRA